MKVIILGMLRRGEQTLLLLTQVYVCKYVNKTNNFLNLGHNIWTCLQIVMHRFLFTVFNYG